MDNQKTKNELERYLEKVGAATGNLPGFLASLSGFLGKEWFFGYLNKERSETCARSLKESDDKRFFVRLSDGKPGSLTLVVKGKGEKRAPEARTIQSAIASFRDEEGLLKRESCVFPYNEEEDKA